MKIDNTLLDSLTAQAKASPRLRMNFDLRTSPEDSSQRMLNAMEPETVVPVHRHRLTSEVVVMLRGSGMQYFYDDEGNMTESVLLEAPVCGDGHIRESFGADGSIPCQMISVEPGRWHRLVSLESGTVIYDTKDGAFVPLDENDVLKVKSAD